MRTLLIPLLIFGLFAPAPAAPCDGENCECATRDCCRPQKGCCGAAELTPADQCGCRTEGCGECASCVTPQPVEYVDTRTTVDVPASAPFFGEWGIERGALETSTARPVDAASLSPPYVSRHVLFEVWLN